MRENPDSERGRRRGAVNAAVRAALAFVLVGAAWIVITDTLLEALVPVARQESAQTIKGIAFMVAASVFVFALVRRYGRQWERADASARGSAEALRRSESRFRSLVERVPGVVWLNEVDRADPDRTRCVYISPQIEDLLGRTPQEWMADVDLWQRVIHPDDLPDVLRWNDQADETGALRMEYRAVHRDGRVVWIHDEAMLIPAEGDRPAYWQGIMVDISDQRDHDRAVHELTESLRGVFEASPLAIIVLEPDGRIRNWNPAAERMLGWRADEVIGELVPHVPPERAEEFEEIQRRTRNDGGVAGLETTRMRRDGSRLDVSVSTAQLVDADGRITGYLAVLADITERKRVAEERRAAQETLARRQRQQEAVAGLGLAAMEGGDLPVLLDEAVSVVASTLDVPISSVFELLPEDETLLLRAGTGWREGLVGSHTIARGDPSPATYALQIGEPVIVDDLQSDWRFPAPADLVEHGVVSGVATVVYGSRGPSGVLTALSTRPRVFARDDVRFLQGIAAIIGLAIERGRAETAMRAAEDRYRGLVEHGPAIVYLHDAHDVPTHVTYISPQIVDLLGYAHEAWTDDPLFWTSLVHPADRERVLDADGSAIRRQTPLDVEYRMIAKDGREVWIQDRAMVVRDGDGEALLRQGVLVDVTDRRRAEEERQRALDRQLRLATRLELLHQIDREVLSSTSIGEMATRSLEHLRLLVPFDRGTVAIIDGADGRFVNVAVRHGESLGPDPGIDSHVPDDVARELLARDVLLVPDLQELEADTPYVSAARDLGIRSVLSIALRGDERQAGALILSSRLKDAFDEEAVDIAKEVGSELAIAIAQAQLRNALGQRAEELGRLAEERRQMLHRIVRAQEEERERVALEIHDGLGQVLTSISLFASDLEQEVGEGARARAVRMSELIRRAIADSRQLVWSLRPPELERLGLVPALRRLADEISAPELTVDLHEQIGDVRLAPESEAVVYRVVQEAVHNAQKHARASAISILLQRHDGQLTTLVEDNGRGFDPAAIPPGRGLGLIGMRERAELVDGSLVVESAADAGTRVRLMVPIGSRGSEGR